jgi:hypothetical protein
MSGQTPVAPAVIAVYPGARTDNPHVYRGQDDIITVPTVFPRYMTPDPHQVQLSNGWDRTSYGARDLTPQASYLSAIAAFQPGQTRLTGSNPGDFVQQGISYQQWQMYAQSANPLGQTYVGAGQVAGSFYNPGSGA